MNERHLTDEEIALLVDGRLEGEHGGYARIHLLACATCRRSHQTAKRFDAVARALPEEKAGPELADRVMQALPRRMYNPVSLRVLGMIGPALGAALVLSSIGVAWLWYGGTVSAIDSGSTGSSALADGIDQVGRTLGSLVQHGAESLTRYAPFLRDRNSATISVFAVTAVAFLATVDRFILRRLEGRS